MDETSTTGSATQWKQYRHGRVRPSLSNLGGISSETLEELTLDIWKPHWRNQPMNVKDTREVLKHARSMAMKGRGHESAQFWCAVDSAIMKLARYDNQEKAEEQKLCREIAARVWCDPEMEHCEMDVAAAEEIAAAIEDVRKDNPAPLVEPPWAKDLRDKLAEVYALGANASLKRAINSCVNCIAHRYSK